MPSTSPGNAPTIPTSFVQVLPGAPTTSLQGLTYFFFRQRSYVAYISGRNLNILSGPYVLAQSLAFGEDLVAVLAEKDSCKIVVAGKSEVWILEPVAEGWTKVWWEKTLFLRREDPGDETRWLSWGVEDEVLVGGNRKLSLFSTLPSSRTSAAAASPLDGELVEERRTLWAISIPSPVQHAAFSHSATLIATCGSHDRLVKVWRRLSFEEGVFDYIYLPHPAAVTHLQWRPIDEHREDPDGNNTTDGKQDDEPEALYTIACDGLLRVWRTGGVHDLEMLILQATIDLASSIPVSPSVTAKRVSLSSVDKKAQYTCIVHSDHFYAAVHATVARRNSMSRRSSQHLIDISSREPDIIISFDGHGRMSAWGLHSIGHKRRPDTPTEAARPPYHITQAENLPIRIPDGVNARLGAWFESGSFNVVGHRFDGELRWWQGDIENFFSPADTAAQRLSEVAYWSGHSHGPVETLRAASVGRGLMSCSAMGEIVHWKSTTDKILQNHASFTVSNKVLDAAVLTRGIPARNYSVTLEVDDSKSQQSSVDLILRDSNGREVSKIKTVLERNENSDVSQLFVSKADGVSKNRIVILDGAGKGYACVVNARTPTLEEGALFTLQVLDVDDPLAHLTMVSDASDPDKVGVICITKSGSLILYHLEPAEQPGLDAIVVAVFQSGFTNASTLAANNDFAAIASSNGTELAMMNLVDGWVEHRHRTTEKVRQLVPAPNNSLVAVAYKTTIDILAQGRIGYREEMPPWVLIKRISLGDVGLTICALTWLGDGSLASAAGSTIFLSSNEVDVEDLDADVREASRATAASQKTLNMAVLAQQLKGSIPIWHPTFVAHIIRHGSWSLAASLVSRLLQKLKFWTEGDALQPLLNVPPAQLYGAEGVRTERTLDREIVTDLTQQLEEKDMPLISMAEQRRLKIVLETMMFCSEHVRGLDNGALRFLFSWKFELLLMDAKHPLHGAIQLNGSPKDDRATVPEMHWREVALAYHSTTQQPLLDILLAHYENKWTWEIARRLGVFAWLSDRDALSQIFEALAQSTYRSTSPPDPINASLYFLALHKKQTLLGLWRIATWHKEQRATMNFLRRDFSQAENQRAAKKNAYALMGKRRFEYAAAFFLLAGDGPSATSILAGQCSDVMLAIAVGRLESGDDSPALRKLIEDRLIPEGKRQGDRWLLSWCYSLLQEKNSAADALIQPLEGVRHWIQDDPSTLTLYRHLRMSPSEYEFDAILRAARILRRMGLWLTALELVSQWKFKPPEKLTSTKGALQVTVASETYSNGTQPSILDGFASPNADVKHSVDGVGQLQPELDEKAAREAKAAELLKKIKVKKEEPAAAAIVNEKSPQPTQFKEPDSNSLLDSFGF